MPHPNLILRVPRPILLRQLGLACLVSPLWMALVPHLPILRTMPGVAALLGIVVAALLFDYRPALVVVVITAIGLDLLRPAAPLGTHLVRALGFVFVGGAVVAIVYGRMMQLRGGELYRALFQSHPMPMYVVDEATQEFVAVNEAALRTYGYSRDEFAKMRAADLEERDVRLGAMAAKDPTDALRHRTKTGTLLQVFVRSNPLALPGRRARVALVEDVTARRATEEQLRQAQKMEAVGQLAGGIAHDFNNLLTAIRGFAGFLMDSLPPDDPRRQDVIEIDNAGARAASLTQQLLAFSRQQILRIQVISLSDTMQDMTPMLRRLVTESIDIRTSLQSHARIEADAVQLQQILVNLVVNARDAVGAGGVITIETADVDLDTTYAAEHAEVVPGRHAVLAVSDNGHGMDEATRRRVFDPFFTTKPQGKGTGLGLATVYGIVKQLRGHVWVYSELHRGTTFKIYFPTTDQAVAVAAPVAVVARPRGVERILVVEDEQTVRTLLRRLLEQDGYNVQVADSPTAARALWEQPDAKFDLLVTDMVLPEASGLDVANAMRERHPDCKVLFMSGYTRDGAVTNGALADDAHFLQKPFAASDVHRLVAAALGRTL